MALDKTDRKLINGAILLALVCLVLYFYPFGWPFDGYGKMKGDETASRENLRNIGNKYAENHAKLKPVHLGEQGEAPKVLEDVAPISDLNRLYKDANAYTTKLLDDKKGVNRIDFPDWTNIPEAERIPGAYFLRLWNIHKELVAKACQQANVDLDDLDIGFKRISSIVPDLEKSKEYLRELYITEKIIELCIKAKLAEELREKNLGKAPEAYMRIMAVEPRDSEPTGPTSLVYNPKFDPTEKNPSSPRFRKFTVVSDRIFIQEYPVKIQLMCDTNTFIHFLHSVRVFPGQFMVIRKLEILSPSLDDSKNDKSEQKDFKSEASEAMPKKRWPQKSEQIVVNIIAAGMDFFDPEKNPGGIYVKAVDKSASTVKPRRVIGGGNRPPPPTRPDPEKDKDK